MRTGRGVFVTGTGTEVGKTYVACTIAATARRGGAEVAVFKPAVSGLDEHGRAGEGAGAGALADHEALRRAAGSSQADDEISPYRYAPPVSPHLGAELAGEPIDPDRLREAARAAAAAGDLLVCEGVGGLLVPLTLDYLVRDLAVDLGLPLVVAAPPTLGTINHTLLTLEAARAAGLDVAAVVLTPWPEAPGTVEQSNRATLERLAGAPVLALERLDLADDPAAWPELVVAGL